jgi:hypothetical protein
MLRDEHASTQTVARLSRVATDDASGLAGRLRAVLWNLSPSGQATRSDKNQPLKTVTLDIVERSIEKLGSLPAAEEERWERQAQLALRLRRESRGLGTIAADLIEERLREEASAGDHKARDALALIDATDPGDPAPGTSLSGH